MNPPKPTAIRLLTGNPSRRPINKHEPQPRPAIPPCPRHLNAPAKAEWQRVTRLLHACGLLTHLDRAALAMYCQAWGRWVIAEERAAEIGAVVRSQEGGYPVLNPYLSIANKAMRQMHSLAAEFGMSPSARSRIQAGELPAEPDPFENLLRSS